MMAESYSACSLEADLGHATTPSLAPVHGSVCMAQNFVHAAAWCNDCNAEAGLAGDLAVSVSQRGAIERPTQLAQAPATMASCRLDEGDSEFVAAEPADEVSGAQLACQVIGDVH